MKNTEQTRTNELVFALATELKGLTAHQLVRIHNEYCYKVNLFDDVINCMDEFDDDFAHFSASTIALRIYYGDFCPNHAFYKLNAYGNLVSFNDPSAYIDEYEIARYAITERKDLCSPTICEFFKKNMD